MSLLDNILSKKSNLTPTKTTIKFPDGSVMTEEWKEGEIILLKSEQPNHGFVVDTKPDLEASLVLPGLFMGSQDVAFDLKLLRSLSIDCIISLGIKVPEHPSIKYYFFHFLDLPEFNLNDQLATCINIINNCLKENKNVYVHCNAGVSRSAAVVIAYLMKHNSWTYDEAYTFLKHIRPVIKPNVGFIKQLKSLEVIFCNKLM